MAVYGDEENQLNKGSLCPRGLNALYQLDREKRIQKPLLRNHLSDSFREGTWNEALDRVADKLRKIKEEFSPASVYLHLSPHGGFGNMVLGKVFGELFGTPNIGEDFSPESSPAGVVLRRMLGVPGNGCAMSSHHEWSSSRSMLLVGVDPASTDPVALGPILDAKDRGTQILVLDSRRTITMSKAHIQLKCRVGTETAVLLGVAHAILRENLFNREFLERWVEGVEEFSALCQKYPPDTVAKISGVRKEDILLTARVLSKNFPSMVIGHSRAGSRETCADQVYAMVSLVALTGTTGCPGGGLNLFYNFPPMDYEPGAVQKPGGREKRLVNVGLGNVWKAILEGKPQPIRAIIWDSNALAFCPRGREVRDALKKIELIVHLGQYPNLTYHHSHVVFPVASFLEAEGLVPASVGRNLQWANRVVDPIGESRPAEDFWGGLLKRFQFQLPSSYSFIGEGGRVDIRGMTRFFLANHPLTSRISPELLDPEKNPPGGIQWPVEGEIDFPSPRASVRGSERLFRPGSSFPGSNKRFPTPTGKINLSLKDLSGEKRFKNFIPPAPESKNFLKKGRFFLITGEMVDLLPSYGSWALPQRPEKSLFLQIHPKQARKLGIHNGEFMTVENKWGKVRAPAWVTDQVDEETIFGPVGGDPYDPHFPFESPCALKDFVPEVEGRGRRHPQVALVRVRNG